MRMRAQYNIHSIVGGGSIYYVPIIFFPFS